MSERHPIFAAWYDLAMIPQDWLGFRNHRKRTVAGATGRVLEIGIGTGLNLALYERADRIVGIEPDPYMLAHALRRSRRAAKPVELLEASGEELPFASATFDAVVATLVFCTIPEPERAAREVRRVLRPGGSFHFFEHVRAVRPALGRMQDWITPLWRRLCGGCQPNRPTLATFERAGFRIERMRTGPGVLVEGVAHAD